MLVAPEITHSQERPTAVIRLTIPRSEMPLVMGPAIGELLAPVRQQGLGPIGPVFTYHFRITPELFDFEVGVPVRGTVQEVGRVKASKLPGTRVARTIYRGPYEELGEAWGEFQAWIKHHGEAICDDLWEVYLKGPESGCDPSEFETQLFRPLQA